MATGHVFMATSVDGFVARKDHSLDWLEIASGSGEDFGTAAFMTSVGVMIMGRGSFETIVKFGIDAWQYEFPVVVASRSMSVSDIPAAFADKVRLSSETPEELMQSLGDEGHKRIYVDGGLLVQSFIKAGLIEDMTLTILPILLGEGLSLFGPFGGDVRLELKQSQAYPFGVVQSTYRFPKPAV